MSTTPVRRRKRRTLVLDNIDWRTYCRLLAVFAKKKVRLAYDRGRLEIMSPRLEHDGDADFLGVLIILLGDEIGVPCMGGGSTTLKRRAILKGVEPDRSYWVANERFVRGKRNLDLRVDPPPDLAIEVDVTSCSLDRMAIYAALGVPEIWRLDDGILTFMALSSGVYAPTLQSRSFPLVTAPDLMGFLAMRATQDDMTVRRQFRAWAQQRIGAAGP